MALDYEVVLFHAGALQRATTMGELMDATNAAVQAMTRFPHAWIAVFEGDGPAVARMMDASDESIRTAGLAFCQAMPVAGDAMLQEILARRRPVVVLNAPEDARTNKELVARLGNRTIVNVPMFLGDALMGALGVGTFGDEGVLPPTPSELDLLTVFGTQLAAAIQRVRAEDARKVADAERARLAQQLESMQRLELMAVMASGVAHDLNNLLSVITGVLGLLQESMEGREDLGIGQAQQAALRAGEMVGRLLALGRKVGTRASLDLGVHLERTVGMLRGCFKPGVKVELDVQPVPTVLVDAVQLDQALANILLNARDAVGDQGVVRVTVQLEHLDHAATAHAPWASAGTYVCVAVTDSGPGIPAELQQRVFEPLFTTKSNGTGLGLPLVARVMRLNGGVVDLRSSPGAGATFRLFLPLANPGLMALGAARSA